MYNTTTACIIYLGLLRGSNDLTATTGGSLALNSDANTTCLSMDSIVLHFMREHFMFCPSPAVNKTVIHIAFKCIAWSSCLCVNRPIWRIYIDKTTLRIGYVQFLCELTMMRLSFLLEQFVRLPDMGF